nr:MAG TPA: hypothetical protein [Caudoviricetes sp.]
MWSDPHARHAEKVQFLAVTDNRRGRSAGRHSCITLEPGPFQITTKSPRKRTRRAKYYSWR